MSNCDDLCRICSYLPAHTNFNTKTCTGLLETDDDNAINLDLNADTIFSDWIYLKRWKDQDKALCSDTAEGRCTN